MIDHRYGRYYVTCDASEEELSEDGFDSWDEAKQALDDAGWTTKNIGGSGSEALWVHLAPGMEGAL